MDFRTTFKIDPSPYRITYNDPAMFVGSCFASEIGGQFELGRMPVMINPSGAIYNPVSVYNSLDIIISNRKFAEKDLYYNNGIYFSFFHNTEFSSFDPEKVLGRINEGTKAAHDFLSSARFLFITFGTARVFRLNENRMIVSNCHKLPSDLFTRELLTVGEITRIWSEMLQQLCDLYPQLKIVFTISPVRHWKDGAHGNQVSKSVLFLAIEELINHPVSPAYFPAYELLIDDLRDYRYYGDDMLHPSSLAVDYIWEAFADSFIDGKAYEVRKEVARIVMAAEHRLLSDSPSGKEKFAGKMLESIEAISAKNPSIDLTKEKSHFLAMIK